MSFNSFEYRSPRLKTNELFSNSGFESGLVKFQSCENQNQDLFCFSLPSSVFESAKTLLVRVATCHSDSLTRVCVSM